MHTEQDRIGAQIYGLRSIAYGVMGWKYHSPGIVSPALSALRAYDMLYSRSGQFTSEGSVEGQGYGAQTFFLSDVTAPPVQDNHGQDLYAGFGGVVLSLENTSGYTPSFGARTIIRRDQGMLNPKAVQDMKRVGLVDREFESIFEVYGTDQVEARAMVTPDFMQRLMEFNDDYLGRNIQCAFIGRQLNICLEIDDRFDFNKPPIFQTYEDMRGVVLGEVAAVFMLLELGQRLQDAIGVQTNETMDNRTGAYYAEQLDIVKAALETPPDNWQNMPMMSDYHRLTRHMFRGYLGQMSLSVFEPLRPPKKTTSKDKS